MPLHCIFYHYEISYEEGARDILHWDCLIPNEKMASEAHIWLIIWSDRRDCVLIGILHYFVFLYNF